MLFRPVRENDLDDIVRLAARAGVGMTSLPHDVGRLAARIRRSIETFAGELPRSQQGFLFVLEDTALARVVGVSAIEVAVGLDEPFYNFRIQKTVRASKALGVYKPQELLNLSYDHTGHSELCTLFLDPAYQRNRNGLLLSKARFLFIAAFREWFSPHLFAELRGCSDEQGQSPFWDALGHHFFDIPFGRCRPADRHRLENLYCRTDAGVPDLYLTAAGSGPRGHRSGASQYRPGAGRSSRKRVSAGAARWIFSMPVRCWRRTPIRSAPCATASACLSGS